MGKAALGLLGVLGLFSQSHLASAGDSTEYSVLIISRERIEVSTNCEIGIYLNDQLSGRCSRRIRFHSTCRPVRWMCVCVACRARHRAAVTVSRTSAINGWC